MSNNYVSESEHKQLVRCGDRMFVATWTESYSFDGKLDGGMYEIDPLTDDYLTWGNTEGKKALFRGMSRELPDGPFTYVRSRDFAEWLNAKRKAVDGDTPGGGM